jgi:hypothetical protein
MAKSPDDGFRQAKFSGFYLCPLSSQCTLLPHLVCAYLLRANPPTNSSLLEGRLLLPSISYIENWLSKLQG